MEIGISTANLYPMRTEESLEQLLRSGFHTIEIFVNTESEVEPSYVREIKQKTDACGAHILAIHPYTSGIEPYLLFSSYTRRFEDGLKHYEHIYEAAALWGASYVILHGDKEGGVLSVEDSLGRFEKLYDLGKSYGITLLQENVVHYRASQILYIQEMRRSLKEKANFTFDLKQCRRCGLKPADVIYAMGKGLRHVHISDQDAGKDCLLPGRGTADYRGLLNTMRSVGFTGDWIIELYRSNFNSILDLQESCKYLKNIINS